MSKQFRKDNRQAAREFLRDAEVIDRAAHDTFTSATYRKPDGSVWFEFESKLESLEYDYSLEPKK